MAELVTQFRESNLWRILAPAALASNTLGLYSVLPESLKKIITHPIVSLLLLYIFIVEAGADQYYALAFIVLVWVMRWREQPPKNKRRM